MRTVGICIVICALLLAVPACKGDTTPATLKLKTMQFGNATRCRVQLYDAGGSRLISEHQSDSRGALEIAELKPGSYSLRYRDIGGRAYSAEHKVTLSPGAIVEMEVELTERNNEGGAAAPGEAGETGGDTSEAGAAAGGS